MADRVLHWTPDTPSIINSFIACINEMQDRGTTANSQVQQLQSENVSRKLDKLVGIYEPLYKDFSAHMAEMLQIANDILSAYTSAQALDSE